MIGPGTELRKIVWSDGSFPCKKLAEHLDRKGLDWCVENRKIIAGWLCRNAKRRGVSVSKILARTLIWQAIRKSRKSTA